MAQNVYDDPYDLALADPRFRAAATAAHTGRWSLLDALWWEWHPEDPAPSGSPSPIHRLRELQRRVFAADGDAAGDHSVAQVVRELKAEIVAERSAATDAITAAHADLRRRTADPRPDDPTFLDPPAANPGPDPSADRTLAPGADGTPAPAGVPTDPAARRRLRPTVIAAVALLAAVGIGAALGSRLTEAGLRAAASPVPSASAATETPDNPAALFAQPQRPRDIPAQVMPATFEPGSFRYLGSADWVDDPNLGVGRSPYYAVRTSDSLICLVALPEGAGYRSTCALESAYPSIGLRLSWESADAPAGMTPEVPAAEGIGEMIGDITVVWGSTGDVTSEWALRPPANP